MKLIGFLVVLLLANEVHAGTQIQLENARTGSPEWQLTHPAEYGEVEGYASLTSVQRGKEIKLFVRTTEPFYTIDVYRMGWYGGMGARLVVGGIRRTGNRQPIPTPDTDTGLIECDWTDPYIVTTSNPVDQNDWMSGVYLAKLTAGSSGKQSYIIFVVRDDERASDYLFQSSVTTFQAYNNWGGKSLYTYNSVGRAATKVSFNRPYAISENPSAAFGQGAGEFLIGWEYNMLRWLEREGYDVTYSTNIDTHADPHLLLNHRGGLSVGHDEYWSWEMRSHVEQARDHHINLAFFSANVCFWQIRLEPSPFTGEFHRTIVSFKDEDPYALDTNPTNDHLATTRWRQSPVDRPEEEFIGVMYEADPVDGDIVVVNASSWVTRGTDLRSSDHLTGLLGYEVDRMFGRGVYPVTVIARSPYSIDDRKSHSDMVFYEMPNGAIVFATGSMQWSWGLDDFNGPTPRIARLSTPAQQMTRNVLARFVGDRFPVAHFDVLTHGHAGVALSFDGQASRDEDGKILHYQWDFGDGAHETGMTTSHTYLSAGRYEVTLTVTDDRGAADRTSRAVLIAQ
jgi:hypothetical protein